MARVKVLFNGPGPQANGLAADRDGLWVCDQKDNRFYKVRYEDGSVLTSFASPARNLSGCGFGGGSVWGGSNIRPSAVTRHDPETGWCTQYIILPNGEGGGVHGLEWYEGALWVTRPGFLKIQKLDPDTGELLHEIPFPEPRNHGIFFKDGYAVVNETNNGQRLPPRPGRRPRAREVARRRLRDPRHDDVAGRADLVLRRDDQPDRDRRVGRPA